MHAHKRCANINSLQTVSALNGDRRVSAPQPNPLHRNSLLKPLSTFDHLLTWFSRTVAIVAVMVVPGLGGAWLDHRWGSTLCTPAGFLIGMALATTLLVVIAKNLTPPAHGKPLPFDDEPLDGEPPEGQRDRPDNSDLAPRGGRSMTDGPRHK